MRSLVGTCLAGATVMLLTASVRADEPGKDDGKSSTQLAQADRSRGFSGFPDWDSRFGGYDRSRRAPEDDKKNDPRPPNGPGRGGPADRSNGPGPGGPGPGGPGGPGFGGPGGPGFGPGGNRFSSPTPQAKDAPRGQARPDDRRGPAGPGAAPQTRGNERQPQRNEGPKASTQDWRRPAAPSSNWRDPRATAPKGPGANTQRGPAGPGGQRFDAPPSRKPAPQPARGGNRGGRGPQQGMRGGPGGPGGQRFAAPARGGRGPQQGFGGRGGPQQRGFAAGRGGRQQGFGTRGGRGGCQHGVSSGRGGPQHGFGSNFGRSRHPQVNTRSFGFGRMTPQQGPRGRGANFGGRGPAQSRSSFGTGGRFGGSSWGGSSRGGSSGGFGGGPGGFGGGRGGPGGPGGFGGGPGGFGPPGGFGGPGGRR